MRLRSAVADRELDRVDAVTRVEQIRQELAEWVDSSGVSPSTLLQLNEPLRSTLKRILRQGSITFGDLADQLGLSMTETEMIADLLVACGFLKTSERSPSGELTYTIRHSRSHRPEAPVAVWNRLFESEDEESDTSG